MNWTRNHQLLLGVIFDACCAAGIATDLILVLLLKVRSISLATWIATEAHPTLIAAGILLSVGIAWLVRTHRGMVFFTGLLAGHLFVHW